MMSASPPGEIGVDDRPTLLQWIAAAVIACAAVMRCMVVFAPQVIFAGDPVSDPTPRTEMGPVGSMLLDLLLLLGALMVFVGEHRRRRRMDWMVFAASIAAVPFVLLHGWSDFDHLHRGLTWFAAAIGAVAAAHLARERELRIVMIAVLIGVLAPILVRGVVQVFIEHARDMSFFREHREQVLRSMGIDPGSTAALIYERRLEQPEASGWFRMANVFGSFMVFGLVGTAGLAMSLYSRGVRGAGLWMVAAAGAAVTGVGLVLAGSQGAYAAAVLGIGFAAVGWMVSRDRRTDEAQARLGRRLGFIAIAVPFAVLLAVVVRGIVLPESFLNDRSVLFRWQYLVGSAGVIGDSPLAGVGPAGFQAAYVQHRLPTAPEEVASPHSVMIDWIATLGLGGLAWCALLLILLFRIGSRLSVDADPGFGHPPSADGYVLAAARRARVFIFAVAMAAFVPAWIIEWPVLLDPMFFASRVLGLLCFIAIAWFIASIGAAHGPRLLVWGFAAACIALVAHAQIEITMTHAGSTVWAFIVLGIVAGTSAGDRRPQRARESKSGIVAAMAVAVILIVLTATHGIAAIRQASAMRMAEAPLRDLGFERWERERREAMPMAERRAFEHRILDARAKAIEALDSAAALMPANPHPMVAAYEQSMLAGLSPVIEGVERIEFLDRATMFTSGLVERDPSPVNLGRHVQANAARFRAGPAGAEHHLEAALASARALARLDPYGVQTHLALADLLWEFGGRGEAAEVYRHILDLNERWHLDPLKQLQESELQRIGDRLAAVEE